jgi:nucleoside-diphosphate-sugar epimerase
VDRSGAVAVGLAAPDLSAATPPFFTAAVVAPDMTETVLVTGGLGRSGRWLVDGLAADYEVVCLDTAHPGFEVAERESITFRAADLTDAGEAAETVAEVDPDAVVHWAALPTPERHAGSRVFETNTMATYNTLVAAGRADARVVWASSESAYGFAFRREDALPDRLPITEDHAFRPEDPYGTSKVVGEEIAKMVVRRYDVGAVSVRPSWIQYPGEYACRGMLAEEGPSVGAGNFWSYVDVRDVVSLVRAALDARPRGHEAVHAAGADTYLDRPTLDAVRDYFGALPDEVDLDGTGSPLSTARAERLFDWTPSHSWREAADEHVDPPTLLLDE